MLIKILRVLSVVALFVSGIVWLAAFTIVQAVHPDFTRYQIALETWVWLVPMVISALLAALFEWLAKRVDR